MPVSAKQRTTIELLVSEFNRGKVSGLSEELLVDLVEEMLRSHRDYSHPRIQYALQESWEYIGGRSRKDWDFFSASRSIGNETAPYGGMAAAGNFIVNWILIEANFGVADNEVFYLHSQPLPKTLVVSRRILPHRVAKLRGLIRGNLLEKPDGELIGVFSANQMNFVQAALNAMLKGEACVSLDDLANAVCNAESTDADGVLDAIRHAKKEVKDVFEKIGFTIISLHKQGYVVVPC